MATAGRTLFWDPVRAVHVAACGLMSVQRNTFQGGRGRISITVRVGWILNFLSTREGGEEGYGQVLDGPTICPRKAETMPDPDLEET